MLHLFCWYIEAVLVSTHNASFGREIRILLRFLKKVYSEESFMYGLQLELAVYLSFW